MSPVKAGAILIVAVAVVTYFGFSKHIPFTHGFRLNAVFESANSIRVGSPVRIAGVEVGKVKEVKPEQGTDAAVVVLQIKDDGLPLHTDPYPNTGASGQPKECEAGNEPYLVGKTVTGNVPGTQPDHTEGNP